MKTQAGLAVVIMACLAGLAGCDQLNRTGSNPFGYTQAPEPAGYSSVPTYNPARPSQAQPVEPPPSMTPAASGRPQPAQQTEPAERKVIAASAISAGSDSDMPTDDAVKVALEWTRKYAQAQEELSRTRETIHAQKDEIRKLQSALAAAQQNQTRLERELKQANSEIMATEKSLAEWKSAVLGIQHKNDRVNAAMLDKLRQIVVLLGGAVEGETTIPSDSGQTPENASEKLSAVR